MKLSLVLHAHQPPGNFNSVFAKATRDCYGPVLDLIEERPALRVSMHWSGSLLEWLEDHAPERIDQLRRLVTAGQVEMLAAGMYEPVLLLLPPHDRLGQLRAHRAYIHRLMGVEPSYGWLTERVWDPSLAGDLVSGGIEGVTLDERHLIAAGLGPDELGAPLLTEWLGQALTLIPAADDLRRAIPWEPVEDVMQLIQRRADAGAHLAVYADDLEKFGLWPGTHRDVIRGRWLARFFDALLDAAAAVNMVPVGEAARSLPPQHRVYVPDGSYAEMLEWSLPAAAQRRFRDVQSALDEAGLLEVTRPFLRTGAYLQFLARYPEVNQLHKRMLDVSARAEPLLRGRRDWDPIALPPALTNLWRAQANCAYWHGLFGGIYFPHIRQRLWHHLLQAERALDEQRPAPPLRVLDLDADRQDEIMITTDHLVVVVDPDEGAVVELSHRPTAVNLGDTIARREEGYHDPGADLHFDAARRAIFVDRVLAAGHPPGRRSELEDQGQFAGRPYSASIHRRRGRIDVLLGRTGQAPGGALRISKRLSVPSEHALVTAEYQVSASQGDIEARFGCEVNLALLFTERPAGRMVAGTRIAALPRGAAVTGSSGCMLAVDGVPLIVRIEADPPADLDVRPVETVARSEQGMERTPQELAILLSWPLRLAEQSPPFTARVAIAIEETPAAERDSDAPKAGERFGAT